MLTNFRILVTENCNASCPTCFNADYRTGKNMTLGEFKTVTDVLRSGGVFVLKVMGGEPFVNPEFLDIFSHARKHFEYITVFTNGLNDDILKLDLDKKVSFTYNFNFIDESFDLKKFRLDTPGYRNLEVHIASDTNASSTISRLKNLKERMGENFYRLEVNLTLNCMENVFEKRDIIISKWKAVYDYCKFLGTTPTIDHGLPLCFQGEELRGMVNSIRSESKIGCNDRCAGLIDANLNLRYCNQNPKMLAEINRNSNIFEINHLLRTEMQAKLDLTKERFCGSCVNFDKTCTGGCFAHKDFIVR